MNEFMRQAEAVLPAVERALNVGVVALIVVMVPVLVVLLAVRHGAGARIRGRLARARGDRGELRLAPSLPACETEQDLPQFEVELAPYASVCGACREDIPADAECVRTTIHDLLHLECAVGIAEEARDA